MRNSMSRFLMICLAASMLMCQFQGSIFAANTAIDSDENLVMIETPTEEIVTISEQELESLMIISESEARNIATSFLKDALEFGDVAWDENTEIMETRKLYNQLDESQITAYSFELTKGYIMVSAFWDSSSLIPEWSDKAAPIYTNFELDSNDEVIYLGAYEYYKDSGGEQVENLYGIYETKDNLECQITEMRNVNNVPTDVLQSIVCSYVEDSTEVETAGVIEDPFDDAESIYNESFSCSDYVNIWGQYTPSYFYHTGVTPSNYYGECGPVAITNMVLTYKLRYPEYISIPSRTELFENIAAIGINNGYYVNDSNIGTYSNLADVYIDSVFSDYGIFTSYSSKLAANYSNIKFQLERDALLYYGVSEHPTYGNHAVMGFAYTRLVGQNTGATKVYVKVADGWDYYARYIDIAASSGYIYGVTFS